MQATQTGASYWVTQIAVCAVAAVAAPALGIYFFTAEPAGPSTRERVPRNAAARGQSPALT